MYSDQLWVPPSGTSPPPELFPLRFRDYTFDRTKKNPLLLPVGGIEFDGSVHVFGFELQVSEDMPSPMCVVINRGSGRKHHLVCAGDMPPVDRRPDCVTPICGHRVRKWKRQSHDGETIMVCTKAAYDDGGRWCPGCIKMLRRKVAAVADPSDGRATHLMLVPMPAEILSVSGVPDGIKDSILSVAYVSDKREYTNPEYGYCNECSQPYHSVRDDESVTDWTG